MSLRLLTGLLALAMVPPALAGTQVQITETSDPPGLHADQRSVPGGVPTVTTTVPLTVGDFRFVAWRIVTDAGANSIPECPAFECVDLTGRALNPVPFTPVEDVTATAEYVDVGDDLDGDGIADFFELRYFGALTVIDGPPAPTDFDFDGIEDPDELRFDFHPSLIDVLVNGGVSAADGSSVPIIPDPTFYRLVESSLPRSIVERTRVFQSGTVTSTQVAPPDASGLSFLRWVVNGVDQFDSLFGAVNPARVTILAQDNLAVAEYLGSDVDTDGDGIPDWFELRYFDTLTVDASTDDDQGIGDGLTLDAELGLGFTPVLVDLFISGGRSAADSAVAQVNIVPLIDYLVTSDPVGTLPITPLQFAEAGETVSVGPVAALASGLRFGFWQIDVDGASPQVARDALGIPTNIASTTLLASTVFTAFYFDPDLDSDGDGLPDWFELGFFGDDGTQDGMDNADGDGLDLATEASFGFSPHIDDAFIRGSVTATESSVLALDLRAFPRVREVIVDGAPEFLFSSDPAQLPDGTFNTGGTVVPARLAHDGDGDQDLLIAGDGGSFNAFDNQGSPVFANFVDRSTDFDPISGFMGGISDPRLGGGDYDGDGLDDAALGGNFPTIIVFRSDGTADGFSQIQQIASGVANTVPGFGVALTSVGLIERDGLFVIGGLLIGLFWVLLLVIGGPAVIYLLVDWMAG